MERKKQDGILSDIADILSRLDNFGNTALSYATKASAIAIVEMLLEAGADLDSEE